MRHRATKYETLTNIRNRFVVSYHFVFRSQSGQAVLTTVIFLLFASVSLLLSFSSIALRETRSSRIDVRAKQSYFLAEAGVEDVVWRLQNNKQYAPSQTLILDGSTATITVASGGNVLTVESSGAVSSAMRRIKTAVQAGAGASFNYGVQVGDGGLEMGANSTVQGSVFSNGNIIGAGGARVMGDAFVAGASRIENLQVDGNARANLIDDSQIGGNASSTTLIDDTQVGGNAWADTFDDSAIGGNAYYKTSISGDTSVGGSRIQISAAPPNLSLLPMPISDETISRWKQDASGIGTIASGACSQDWSPPTDPYTTDGGVLERNLKLDNNQTLILRGTVWVKCNVDIDNGGEIRLDSSYGSLSGVLIADGWMHLKNNGEFRGSGVSGSYLMLLTTASGGGHHGSAVDLHNNAAGAIFYAGNGMVYLHNNVQVMELTARKAHLENNSRLIYESGLVNVNFSSGPTGGWQIKSWGEVK